ncbi:hypothetical protein C2G38_2219087 [Gigaspora rosea]|uniref:Uncharacterized protein n=1 Tax=Gigaspora rosea TaxID=44941 RepID=A0A397U7F5_9GLOM|nr:hypothetical protein C2G38_2219087 [Gigaspora rosea]
MRVIYLLIIVLISIQNYSIYAQQNHPLAKLWGINDAEVPEWLGTESHLKLIDGILRPILEFDDNFSSSELLALPQISPFNESLHFENVTYSMKELKDYFQGITLMADSYDVQGALIYIYYCSSRRVPLPRTQQS